MSRFGIIPTRWMAHEELTSSDKLTLAVLSTFADPDGYCWPSVRTIAERASLSERSVQYALRNLEVVGALIVQRRANDNGGNSSNGYWITGYDIAPGVVQSLREGDADIARGVVHPLHPNIPNKNSLTEHATTPPTTAVPGLTFPSEEMQEAYLTHRRMAPNRRAFDQSLQAILNGMTTGKPVAAEVMGLALMDMAANGEAFNASRVRGYIRKHESAQAASAAAPQRFALRYTFTDEERARVAAELEAEYAAKQAKEAARA